MSSICPQEAFGEPKTLINQGFFGYRGSFPLFFEFLLWHIYALNIILNGKFDNNLLSIISFIRIFVAKNVAKAIVGLCRVAVMLS